ncbi:MAG: prepilin-type N-terminal cleavage/methylation domain-containing protein [Desulfobaccales bacterium]
MGRTRAVDQGGPAGFTLLEVLVATTLMGLVLLVLLQVLTATIRTREASWNHTQAILVAEKVLQENCELNSLTGGTYQGREGLYDYKVNITPQFQISTPFRFKQLFCSLIQVTVLWKERGANKSLVLTTARSGTLNK